METLTKPQKSVLKLIFEHRKTEEEALEEAKISQKVYDGWFKQSLWRGEYNRRIKLCQRRADQIVAAYKELAAIKLIQLTDCEKEVTARQACLDVLGMETEQRETTAVGEKCEMKRETQEAILKIMASEEKE